MYRFDMLRQRPEWRHHVCLGLTRVPQWRIRAAGRLQRPVNVVRVPKPRIALAEVAHKSAI
jgi:hypothetical protein